jgi:hypothetical protein
VIATAQNEVEGIRLLREHRTQIGYTQRNRCSESSAIDRSVYPQNLLDEKHHGISPRTINQHSGDRRPAVKKVVVDRLSQFFVTIANRPQAMLDLFIFDSVRAGTITSNAAKMVSFHARLTNHRTPFGW